MYLRIALIAILGNILLSKLQRLLAPGGEQSTVISNFLETAPPAAVVIFFFLIIIVAPVIEELLFRGLLWKILSYVFPIKVVCVVVALLFALAHAWPAGVFLLPVAAYLSYLRYKEKSILPGMAFHVIFNATGILLPYLLNRSVI